MSPHQWCFSFQNCRKSIYGRQATRAFLGWVSYGVYYTMTVYITQWLSKNISLYSGEDNCTVKQVPMTLLLTTIVSIYKRMRSEHGRWGQTACWKQGQDIGNKVRALHALIRSAGWPFDHCWLCCDRMINVLIIHRIWLVTVKRLINWLYEA